MAGPRGSPNAVPRSCFRPRPKASNFALGADDDAGNLHALRWDRFTRSAGRPPSRGEALVIGSLFGKIRAGLMDAAAPLGDDPSWPSKGFGMDM
mmetsp:Transcript_2874/g.6840  ORF Transcript_2874/g.6840 Transcript_2874/m.6840 type:complete len:94 (+) Transcript_2874:974-1255(+)